MTSGAQDTSTAAPRITRRTELLIPIILAGLSMIGPFSIDTPFPAFAEMRLAFGVGAEPMQLLVSIYMLAFAVMSLLHGPLSDALGRRPVILAGVAAYGLASVGAALSRNFELLLLFRAIQGLSAGGGVIVSRTIIRDMYDGPRAQRLMSQVAMIFGLAPAIAPVLGGFVLQLGPWPGIFWFQAGIAAVLVASVLFILPESHPRERRSSLQPKAILGNLGAVLRSGAFHRIAWSATFVFAAWFVYIGGAAIIVVDLWGRNELDFWMLFLPLVGGVVLGSWVSSRAAGRIGGRRLITIGYGIALIGGVVNLALANLPNPTSLPQAIIGPALGSFGASIAFPTTQLALLDLFPRSRGAATSMGAFLTLLLNAALASFLAPVVATASLRLAITQFALVAVGAVLWAGHVVMSRRELRIPTHPQPLESDV